MMTNFFSNTFQDKQHLLLSGIFIGIGLIIAIIKLLLFGMPGLVFAGFGLIPFIVFAVFTLFIKTRWVIITSGSVISLIALSIFFYTLYSLLILQGNAAPLMFIITPLPEGIAAVIITIGLFLSDIIYKTVRKTKA